jgi:hypothetical protein
MKLRETHYQQLLSYLNDVESNGWYYGNKQQFMKRHNELKEWVNQLIEAHNQDKLGTLEEAIEFDKKRNYQYNE